MFPSTIIVNIIRWLKKASKTEPRDPNICEYHISVYYNNLNWFIGEIGGRYINGLKFDGVPLWFVDERFYVVFDKIFRIDLARFSPSSITYDMRDAIEKAIIEAQKKIRNSPGIHKKYEDYIEMKRGT